MYVRSKPLFSVIFEVLLLRSTTGPYSRLAVQQTKCRKTCEFLKITVDQTFRFALDRNNVILIVCNNAGFVEKRF